ncbi:Dabb family protein [Rhizohabitans arisaemae]|uniref:Dabb family protein n=1 Tax=Rhizohabitans arisaemae TaxID=2720610 RepID=UPI0024B16EAD|nr:Dabb family protein [Rhizohabitans arisaemae]
MSEGDAMIRHVVLFTWADEATNEQRKTVAAELSKLPGIIEQIRDYRLGDDLGISPGNQQFALVADFDDVESFLVYRDHPAHQAVIRDHIKPILASRAAVQYEL